MIQSNTQNVGWISAAHPPKSGYPPKPVEAHLFSVEDIEVELSGDSDEPFGGCATAYPPYQFELRDQPVSGHHIVGWISAAHPPKPVNARLPSVEDIEVELSGGSND
ncbi:MAG: hypothetical protein PHE96_01585 [Methylococcales bacterium]|nr:hypothetical protein [Methylococcales bacterium]